MRWVDLLETYLLERASQPTHDGLEIWLRREEQAAAREMRQVLQQLSDEMRAAVSQERRAELAERIREVQDGG